MESKFDKPQAYFIDIDGTLVSGHRNHKLNLDDKFAMKNAAKKKTYIILSTGRSLVDIKDVWEQIKDGTEYTAFVVVNNGSGIYNLNTDELLFEDYIDEQTYRSIFDYVKEKRYAIKNSQESIFFSNNKTLSWALSNFSKRNSVSPNFSKAKYNKDSSKKLGIICSHSKKKVAIAAAEIDKKFKEVDVAISGPGLYIEVNKKNVSKGTAIKFLCDHIGIDIKRTVHIGDSMNDAPAFKVAGHGVAMGNGMKELKNVSDFITSKRKDSGVANTIKSFGTI